MLIIDGVLFFAIGAVVGSDIFGSGIIAPVITGAVFAYALTRLMKVPFLGRVMQILVGIFWVYALQYAADALFVDPGTGRGVITMFRENEPVYYSAALVIATIASSWLQFRFVGDRYGYDVLDGLLGFTRRRKTGHHTRFGYGGTGGDAFRGSRRSNNEVMQEELDKYHQCFNRIKELVDEITRCEAFKFGGDIVFDAIAASMSFIQDNNAEVERLCAGFEDEDNDEQSRIISYLFRVNGQMLSNETALKNAYSELKERYKEHAYTRSREESSRRRRSFAEADPRVTMFFNGCTDREKLDKRYKSLAKTYHPDMESGDTETMALINQEYERLKEFLG